MSDQQPEASTSTSTSSTSNPTPTTTTNNELKARTRSTRKDKDKSKSITNTSLPNTIPKTQKTRSKPIPTPIRAFENPAEGEEETVHEVYERIAPHFAQTRHKPWPLITSFLSALPPHSIGLDSGCGNGKYLPTALSHECRMIGMDRSLGLLEAASGQEGGEDLVRGDLGGRGWRDGVFDFTISVAAIHHLSTPERRKQAVQALLPPLLHRSKAPYSRFFIYVWAYEQGEMSKRRMGTAASDTLPVDSGSSTEVQGLGNQDTQDEQVGEKVQDVLVPWVLKSKPKPKSKPKSKSKSNQSKSEPDDTSEINPSPPIPQDNIPDTKAEKEQKEEQEQEEEEKVYHRYYHLFVQGELENLVVEAGKEQGYRVIPRHTPHHPSVEEIAMGLVSLNLKHENQRTDVDVDVGIKTSEANRSEKWLRVRGIGWEADNWWIEAEVGSGAYISEEKYGIEAA